MIINYLIENRDLEGCYFNGKLLLSGNSVKLQALKNKLQELGEDPSLALTSETVALNAKAEGDFSFPETSEELLTITEEAVEEVA